MKVNISGKGIIPSLRRLAPVMGAELSEKDIRKLLTYRYFKLYDAETGIHITRENVDAIFKPVQKVNTINSTKPAPIEEPAPVVEEINTVIEEELTPVDEEEPVHHFLNVVEITPKVEESRTEEIINIEEEAFDEVEKELEFEEKEEPVEEKPKYYNKKKKKH